MYCYRIHKDLYKFTSFSTSALNNYERSLSWKSGRAILNQSRAIAEAIDHVPLSSTCGIRCP
jgi:hypothetical protein